MPIRIGWDKYEIVLLIDACERVAHGESKKLVIHEVSLKLRQRAVSRGIKIDDLYRNENGIDLQMTKMEYLLTDGKKGLPGASKFFAEIVNTKKNNPKEYAAILQEAQAQVGYERSGATIMPNNRTIFAEWLNDQQSLKLPADRIVSVLDESSEYAQKHGVSKTSIWELYDVKTFSEVYRKLSSNRLFRTLKKSTAQALDKAYSYYRDFLIQHTSKPAADNLVASPTKDTEDISQAPAGQNLEFERRVRSALQQLSDERNWGVSVLAIYEIIGGSLQEIKAILDAASWAEASGKSYRYVIEGTNESKEIPSLAMAPESEESKEASIVANDSTTSAETQPSYASRQKMEADFLEWMRQKHMAESTAKGYLSALRSAESYAHEKGLSDIWLITSDYAKTIDSIDTLLANKDFIQFNKLQFNRFGVAFRKVRDFVSEVGRREGQLTSDTEMEIKYPELYRKLYSISKIYDDPHGVTVEHICLMVGSIASKSELVEFLDRISWAHKLSEEVYAFGEKAGSVTAQISMTADQTANAEVAVPEDYDSRNFIAVLIRRFPSGMEFDSIDLEIFRDTYSDLYDETLTFSDEDLEKRLKLCGVMYKDRIFPADGIIDPATKERLFAYIENQFASGSQVLYYKAIFSDLSDAFAYCFSLTDETMLKAYLEFVSDKGQFFFNESYMSKEANIEIDHAEEVINFMLDAGKPMSYEDIYAGLSHIDKDIIYREIHGSSKFVMNEREHYFHIDIFEFSQTDGEHIAAIFDKEINENGYAIWSKAFESIQEQLPVFLENNLYLSSLGIRNALSQFMSDRFNFEGEVISACGVHLSMGDVFRLYAKHHTPFSDKQIQEFSREVGSPIYFWALAEESVRVSKSLFVAKDQIHFDVDAVDKAIETYLVSGYILLKEVNSFLVFPNVGYEWNEYLLESFLLHYSKKYTLVNNGTSLNNVAGAIASKDGEFTQFVDVCAQALADSNVELKKATALNYLAEVNLITRRSYKELESAMTKARRIRNRKG